MASEPTPIEKIDFLRERFMRASSHLPESKDRLDYESKIDYIDMLLDGTSEILIHELGGISLEEALNGST